MDVGGQIQQRCLFAQRHGLTARGQNTSKSCNDDASRSKQSYLHEFVFWLANPQFSF